MTPPGREPRYLALSSHARFPAGQREEVFYDARGDRVHQLRPELAALLVRCEALGPATLSDLTAGIARMLRIDARATPTLRAHLGALANMGLLVREDAIREELSRGGGGPPPPSISALGIVTADRPASLLGCLKSHVRALAKSGRTARITIADGSRDPESAAKNQAAARSVDLPAGVTVAYLGREERIEYAAKLAARSGVPVEVIRFALWPEERFFPRNIGANRNALLLDAAGEMAVQVDDDTFGLFALPPEPRAGLAITAADPVEHWFPALEEIFPGRALQSPGKGGPAGVLDPETLSLYSGCAEDVLTVHEELLGQSLSSAIAAAGPSEIALSGSAALLERAARQGARVRMTSSGIAGDSGFGSALNVVLAKGASRARLVASEEVYRRAVMSRGIVRAAPGLTITSAPDCMATVLGLDGREVLPPFTPVERDEDGLFGFLLHLTARGSFNGHLPRISPHLPPVPRRADIEGELSTMGSTPLNYLLSALLGASGEPRFARTEDNLARLGYDLFSLASQPAEAHRTLRTAAARTAANNLVRYERLLAEHTRAPAFWARDVERISAAMRSHIEGPRLGRAAEIEERASDEEARSAVLGLARSFGALLQAWPALHEAARELHQEGVRPSAPLPPD